LYGCYEQVDQDGKKALSQYVVVEHKALTPPGKPLGVRTGCCLMDDDESKSKPRFQACWNGFLRLYNYYQFLPYSYFVTSEGNKAKVYEGIKLFQEPLKDETVPEKEAVQGRWDEVKELTGEQFHGLLDLLQENGWTVPAAGYELEGAGGEIVAGAELGWEDLKIAFLTDEETEYQKKFMELGWKTAPISEVLDDPKNYLSTKDSQGE
jgi:DEAD/DEAH box helicase domain-containing protein